MIKRNPYANVSLAAPELNTPNFSAPTAAPMAPIQFSPIEHAPMPESDTGGQVAGLGNTFLNLKKRFGGAQGDMIKDALGGEH